MAGQSEARRQTQDNSDWGLSLDDRIDICVTTHQQVGEVLAHALPDSLGHTEVELRDRLKADIAGIPGMYEAGWYSPPPEGIGVLFAGSGNYQRSHFPTLRTEEYWPSSQYRFDDETVGMAYVSPVHKASGMIADFGLMYYQGSNQAIQAHLRNCLEATEAIAEEAAIGMPLKELYARGEQLLRERGLHNDWMVTFNDPLGGADYGHTWPWTYDQPTSDEQEIITAGALSEVRGLIATNRIYINAAESSTIPESIVFSVEPRMGSRNQPELPGGYYYALVIFRHGQREIITHLNPVLDALNITYMRSRF